MRSALGPCPPLFVLQHPRLCIRDVLLPLAEVSPHAWVEGHVVLRARTARPPCGAHVVADLHVDAATPIRVGSRVHYSGLGGNDFTVKALSADDSTAKLFYDVRGEEYYLDDQTIGELVHLPQSIPLLSVDGAATAFTRFGVGVTGNRKQLWLRNGNGRAYRPHDKELTRLHELCDVAAETYDDANVGRGAMSSGEAAENGISVRMCESQAARASLRERRLQNCVTAQPALDSAATCHLHRACIMALATVEPWPDVGTYIVFLRRPTSGPSLALMGADLVSLPLLERRSVKKTRARPPFRQPKPSSRAPCVTRPSASSRATTQTRVSSLARCSARPATTTARKRARAQGSLGARWRRSQAARCTTSSQLRSPIPARSCTTAPPRLQ